MKNLFSNLFSFLFCNLLLMLGSLQILHAQSNNNMGVGTTTPHASAILDVYSNTKGLLLPRPTAAPTSPAAGLMYFGGGYVNYFDGSAWRATGLWGLNGSKAYYNAGNVGIGTNNPTTAKLVINAGSGNTGIDLASSDSYVEMRVIRNSLSGIDKHLYIGYGAPTSANTYLYSGGTTPTMTLKGGSVGIGTDTPNSKLGVAGGIAVGAGYATASAPGNGAIIEGKVGVGTSVVGSYQMAIKHGSFGLQIQSTQSGTASWELWQNSPSNVDLQLYTTNTTGGSDLVGSFNYSTGVYSASSDRRLKENISPLNNILPSLMQLEAKNYTYKSDPKKTLNIGFIAQDVEKIFPEIVVPPSISERGESNYLMNYSGFGIIAVKAIQEQQVIIETQAKKIEAQQAEIDAIKKALAKSGIKLD